MAADTQKTTTVRRSQEVIDPSRPLSHREGLLNRFVEWSEVPGELAEMLWGELPGPAEAFPTTW